MTARSWYCAIKPSSGRSVFNASNLYLPAIDRPQSKWKECQPYDTEPNCVTRPIPMNWCLQDPLTAAHDILQHTVKCLHWFWYAQYSIQYANYVVHACQWSNVLWYVKTIRGSHCLKPRIRNCILISPSRVTTTLSECDHDEADDSSLGSAF